MKNTKKILPAVPVPALSPEALRWRCDPSKLEFETTEQVEPLEGIIGQESAVESLRFGLETDAPGQNVFVRGLSGSGRLTLVRDLLEEIRPPSGCAPDRCYVHRFSQPDRPRLLTITRGRATAFRDKVDELIDFIRQDLSAALNSDILRGSRADIERRGREELESVSAPFEKELRANDLALVRLQMGRGERQAIVPLIDGKPVSPDEFDELRTSGKITTEEAARIAERIQAHHYQLEGVAEAIQKLQARQRDELRKVIQAEARAALTAAIAELLDEFKSDAVSAYLDEVVEDLVTRHLENTDENAQFLELYRVNVVCAHTPDEACPVLVENIPEYERLVGSMDGGISVDGHAPPEHMTIQAGALLRADGGYLILEARDVAENGASWQALVRTLRSGLLEITAQRRNTARGSSLKPESIPISVKVILIGSGRVYATLDAMDPDFPHLFKVLADFDSTIPRNDQGVRYYAGFLSRLARNENLAPFDRGAVAALTEHGARIAGTSTKLTARLGRVADIAREAAHVAEHAGCAATSGDHVREAVRRTRRRASLPARKFRDHIADGSIRIHVTGTAVGEVNGLAVTHSGPISYGFPVRLTATMSPGTGGTVNIEREADLSGSIHTKGFYILGGLLRHLLRGDHPLVFDASIAFEQSYGGIDGDSASGAEMCCLLSALTEIPLRQGLAMTGAIDQVGNILPIGAVNEKVEGFFGVCRAIGLTGEQGVIIPRANAGDLMLRQDVIEACSAGKFCVHAVDTIQEALGLFTGVAAGTRREDGRYPKGSLLRAAADQARSYWEIASRHR